MSSPPRPEGLRERKKARTRRTIQEQALRLFAEQGYEATTVEQIAEAAEISPSTFFRYFPTKEDVVVQDDYDPVMLAALAAQPAGLAPVPALRAAMREAFAQIPPEEEEQIRARTRLQLSHPALRARAVDNMIATIDVFTRALSARMDPAPAGRAAAGLLARTAAGAVVGAMLAALFSWAEDDGPRPLADVVDEALALLESGLRP
ncbi:acyl-CoA-like ligand-binding transcription factor [Planomonospora parontospora]|uniref:acyl-CoA-like ligand-binding transcription factor n=1 Tax=Planomonospora parontospora TaxID=58119 RepID=UPI001670170A|nr:TetR family transcriptional regulator [Planomonospora parontospora]GGL11285.1 TetR family transcriptional regulator [Planomonospora parontospora subsp. antibiotica]GII14857.1 TetR family transcriptional regulator [Planomonospora parontospora subsp. antibiotica]